MKTLYITDLDGTLLRPDATLSEKSVEILNRLMRQGANFTVATARSFSTTIQILKPLNLVLPIAMMNGVTIYDLASKKYLDIKNMHHSSALAVDICLKANGVSAFMFTIENNILHTYYDVLTPQMTKYKEYRSKFFGKKFSQVEALSNLCDENVVYFSTLGKKEYLEKVIPGLKQIDGIKFEFYRDVYSDTVWFEELWYLEIFDSTASKKSAVEFMRSHFGFDKVVCFGDNLNDIPMFEASDIGCAVQNAREELKAIATEVIGANSEEGVASWLEANFVQSACT